MKKIILLFCLITAIVTNSQEIKMVTKADIHAAKENEYNFKTIVDIEASSVKSQGKTGTCWSFSTSSFLESEINRLSGKKIDVSEMYTVRNTYFKKAWIYVMRQGKAQLSDGGLGHQAFNTISKYGLVPESVFSGLKNNNKYDHTGITNDIKAILDDYIKNDTNSNHPNWKEDVNTILDKRIGEDVKDFVYEGKVYTPQSFLEMTQINPTNYVTITSFTHVPYYKSFILNIPDNFDFGSFYNVPLDDLNTITQEALKKGYSLEWDGDVSEKTFSSKYGIAVLPNDKIDNENSMTHLVKEMKVTPDYRQQEFENFNTTDDHLMHITGLVVDQKGNIYYKIKNSWGTNSERIGNDGYILMSEAYFKLKTISIMLHKDAITKEIRVKLSI